MRDEIKAVWAQIDETRWALVEELHEPPNEQKINEVLSRLDGEREVGFFARISMFPAENQRTLPVESWSDAFVEVFDGFENGEPSYAENSINALIETVKGKAIDWLTQSGLVGYAAEQTEHGVVFKRV